MKLLPAVAAAVVTWGAGGLVVAGHGTSQPEKTPGKDGAPTNDGAKSRPVPEKRPEVATDATAGHIASADDLLAALETADKDLRSLQADILYSKIAGELEGGEREMRYGTVAFVSTPAGEAPRPETGGAAGPASGAEQERKPEPDKAARRMLRVTFDRIKRGQEVRDENRSFIFRGNELLERLELDKHVNKYSLGPADKVVDPLKIGEGPFPLPFGQKKEDITSRFTTELLPGTDGLPDSDSARKRFGDAYQLKLIPRPGVKAAKDFKEARIWYNRSDLLPVMARTQNVDGGSDEVQMINIKLNQPVDEKIFDTSVPEGWTVDQKEMK